MINYFQAVFCIDFLRINFFLVSFLFSTVSYSQWSQYPSIPVNDIYCVKAYDTNFYYSGAYNLFHVSTNAGNSWSNLPILDQSGFQIPATAFYDIHFVSPTVGIAVGFTSIGNQEVIFKTTNGGINWTPVNIYTGGGWPRFHHSLFFTSSTTGFAVGTNGRIMRTTDAGSTWTAMSSGTTTELHDVFFTSSTNGFAVGVNIILKTTNGGTNWSATSISSTTFRSVHFPTSATGYAAGNGKKFYKTTNGGTNWTQLIINIPGSDDITQIHFTDANTGYITAGSAIYKTIDGGIYWEKHETNDEMNYVYFRSQDNGFAAGLTGQLFYNINSANPGVPVSFFAYSPVTTCNDSLITFINLSDPSWSYQWLLNGAVFSTSYSPTLVINNPAQTDTVSLIADNGFYTDTFSMNIYVQQSLNINLQTGILNDTVCSGQNAAFYVYNSELGVVYKLRNNTTQIGAQQNGNNGTLTFSSGVITASDTFNIYATKTITNCGSNSETDYIIAYIGNPPVDNTVYAQSSSICYNSSTQINLLNSVSGVSYQLKKGAINIGSPQTGNGGTLVFNTGTIITNSTFTIAATSAFGCTSALSQSASVSVEKPYVYFTVNTYNPEVNQSVFTVNNSINPGGSYEWTFFPSAIPSNASTPVVSGITFSSGGPAYIKLTAISPVGCRDSVTKPIYVIDSIDTANCRLINSAQTFSTNGGAIRSVTRDNNRNLYALTENEIATEFITYAGNGDSIRTTFPSITNYSKKYTLSKYNVMGLPQWNTFLRFESTWAKNGAVETDPQGNIYMAYFHADFSDSCRIYSTDGRYITFNPPHSGSYQQSVVIVKYDSLGIYQWHQTFLDFYTLYRVSMSIDINGDIFVSGEESMVKLTPAGNILWSLSLGDYSDVVPDENGGAWVVERVGFNLKHLNSSGVVDFTTPVLISGSGSHYINRDENGNIYFVGELGGTFYFNGDTISDTSPGGVDLVLCKLRNNGQQVWVKQIQSAGGAIAIKGFDIDENNIAITAVAYGDSVFLESGQSEIMANPSYIIYKTDTLGFNEELIKFYETSQSNLSNLERNDGLFIDAANNSFDLGFEFNSSFSAPGLVPVNLYSGFNYKNMGIYSAENSCVFTPVPPSNIPAAYFIVPFTRCENVPVPLTDMSFNNPTSWSWSFPGGNPTSSNLQNPFVIYSSPGVYQATLISSNINGTSNAFTQNIVVNPTPVVIISGDTLFCESYSPYYTASGATTYQWGDGNSNNIIYPDISSDTTITVIGYSQGCADTSEIQITLETVSNLSFGSVPDSVCITDPLFTISPAPSGGDIYDDWGALDFSGNYNPSAGGLNQWNTIYYDYYSPLTGCLFPITDSIFTISCSGMPPIASFTSSGNICQEDTVFFVDGSSNNPNSWLWDFDGGNGVTNTSQNPYAVFSIPGTYVVTLVSTNAFGNSNTYAVTIEVFEWPLVDVNDFSPDTICGNGGSVSVPTANPSGGIYWDDYGSVSGNLLNPAIGPTGWRYIYYGYTDLNGCYGEDNTLVYIEVCNGVSAISETQISILTLTEGETYLLTGIKSSVRINIINLTGQIILSDQIYNSNYKIDLSDFATGIYLLEIENKISPSCFKLLRK